VSKISVANPDDEQEALVDADFDTLATALYVRTDDLLKAAPDRAPWCPAIGIVPKISDAELVTLAVMQALLGTPARRAAPALTCATCSLICRNSLATTSGCGGWATRSGWLVGMLARGTTM
jgi:hypothetical protein